MSVVTVSIGEGSLGMTVDPHLVVARVNSGSNAEKAGVCVNWTLVAVNDASLDSLSHEAALGLIRSAPRPLSLSFRTQIQPEAAAPTAAPPAPVAAPELPPEPPLAVGAKESKQARGGLISGLLSGSKEVLRILSEKATLPPVPVVRLPVPKASDAEIGACSHPLPPPLLALLSCILQ